MYGEVHKMSQLKLTYTVSPNGKWQQMMSMTSEVISLPEVLINTVTLIFLPFVTLEVITRLGFTGSTE